MFRADSNWWRGSSKAPAQPLDYTGAASDSLVSPDGSCPASEAPPRGIALGMTECDLVRVAGATSQVSISNERGERSTVMTYAQGERAGIYRFRSGVLVTIDRVAEPEQPKRPPRRQKQQPQKRQPPAPPRGY